MDRADAAGLGVAAAGHIALLAALSLGFANSRLPPIRSDPIEVSLVSEAALESTAPSPSAVDPAARLAPVEGPVESLPQPAPAPTIEPTPPPPVPAPAPAARAAEQPRPAPLPARPAPKAAPSAPPAPPSPKAAQAKPKASPARPTGGRLTGLLAGLSERDTPSKATTPPASKAGPAVEASLTAEVGRQLRPHWQRVVPTGADAEDLKTVVSIRLDRDGRVTGIEVVRTTGITPSNRPQVALHQERAKKAVMLASPFRLPGEYYDAWKEITATLDLRLSQ